jgi:hypothetical protein
MTCVGCAGFAKDISSHDQFNLQSRVFIWKTATHRRAYYNPAPALQHFRQNKYLKCTYKYIQDCVCAVRFINLCAIFT